MNLYLNLSWNAAAFWLSPQIPFLTQIYEYTNRNFLYRSLFQIEDLRKRVKEKETAVDKKIKQMTNVQGERKQLEVEIKELKDQMDIKDRKVLVLQKKVSGLDNRAR